MSLWWYKAMDALEVGLNCQVCTKTDVVRVWWCEIGDEFIRGTTDSHCTSRIIRESRILQLYSSSRNSG